MHTLLPFFLAMVAAIVLLQMFAVKLKVAYPILLVVAGLLVSFVPGLPVVKINPDLIFFIFLPPLLFEASWSISFKEMRIIISMAWTTMATLSSLTIPCARNSRPRLGQVVPAPSSC